MFEISKNYVSGSDARVKNVQNTVFLCFIIIKTSEEHIKYGYEFKYSGECVVFEILEQTKSYLSTKPL